jgi:hypothetical protein
MKNGIVIGCTLAGTPRFSSADAADAGRRKDADEATAMTMRRRVRRLATLRAGRFTAALPRGSAPVREFDEGLLRYERHPRRRPFGVMRLRFESYGHF